MINKTAQAAVAVTIGLLVGACGSDGTQPVANTQVKSNPKAGLTPPAPVPQINESKNAAVPSQIPSDAKYTLYTMRFTGPGHVQEGKLFRDRMMQTSGRNDWMLIHEDQQTVLYFGYYREVSPAVDPVDGARCQADIKWLQSVKDPVSGQRRFVGVLAQPLPSADPPAPAEWNLALIDKDKDPLDPNRQYWSLVVAGYTIDAQGPNKENRKQLAVDTVRDMRKAGIPAFFYHGPNVSQVCVGTWKRTALVEQESKSVKPKSDRNDVVVSPIPLSPERVREIQNAKEGTEVFQPNVQVVDPSLAKMMNDEQFRFYAVNGELQTTKATDPNTGAVTVRHQPSFIVEIPRLQPSILSGSIAPADSINNITGTPTIPPPNANPVPPRTGQLRGLGQ